MVDAIGETGREELFTDAESAAIVFTIELTRNAHVGDEAFERARRHFDDRQLVELVVNVGIANLNNRFTEAFWADVPDA
jgi:alkylhydroperoxidase family enzyme